MKKDVDKKPVKICYGHIGGKLGTMLKEAFEEKGWIVKRQPSNRHFSITDKGLMEFEKLGLDLSQIKSEEL